MRKSEKAQLRDVAVARSCIERWQTVTEQQRSCLLTGDNHFSCTCAAIVPKEKLGSGSKAAQIQDKRLNFELGEANLNFLATGKE